MKRVSRQSHQVGEGIRAIGRRQRMRSAGRYNWEIFPSGATWYKPHHHQPLRQVGD